MLLQDALKMPDNNGLCSDDSCWFDVKHHWHIDNGAVGVEHYQYYWFHANILTDGKPGRGHCEPFPDRIVNKNLKINAHKYYSLFIEFIAEHGRHPYADVSGVM